MLIIKCYILKVKHLTLLSRNIEKMPQMLPRLQKMELDFNKNLLLYRMQVGR